VPTINTSSPEHARVEGPESTPSTDDSWKTEYDTQVKSWQAQSSMAREKAEKERARWESIRATERAEAALKPTHGVVDASSKAAEAHMEPEWETVGSKSSLQTEAPSSPSPADGRDLVTGEAQKQSVAPEATAPSNASHSQQNTVDDSQKWEDVPSIESSFPSLSFHELTQTPSPPRNPPAPAPGSISATLAIFDSSLSTRTRIKALFSSIAINMFLPFVNGVMLGFGEIFAKNIVMEWFGWRPLPPPIRRLRTSTIESQERRDHPDSR